MSTAEDEGAAARQRVLAHMAEREWDNSVMAAAAGIDAGTLTDFLRGVRRPRKSTLAKLDKALGLTPGTLAAGGEDWPASGEADPNVSPASNDGDDGLLYRHPDGLATAEWERIKSDARRYIEWQVEKALEG